MNHTRSLWQQQWLLSTVNDKKAESDALYTKTTPEGEQLTGLRLGGKREALAFVELPMLPIIEIPVVLPIAESIEINDAGPCGDCDEILPTCDWVPIPMSDDMEEVVISDVDGILPDAEIINYKLVCQARQ